MRLVLASASPRRAELLTSAGFTFEIVRIESDERRRPGEAPPAYVRRLACDKSARGLEVLSGSGLDGDSPSGFRRQNSGTQGSGGTGEGYPDGGSDFGDAASGRAQAPRERDVVVLGADTAVVLDDEILGKPRDEKDARAMLRQLSGRKHDVLTGVSLRTAVDEVGLVEATSVWFAALTPDEVAWYVSTGEGRDKAGGYAIQGLASRFIPRIEGSYSNVVGLPVTALGGLLRRVRVQPMR